MIPGHAGADDSVDVWEENRTVDDVASAFDDLARWGEWSGFYIGPISPQLELFPKPFNHHIQGMARSPRTGVPPIFSLNYILSKRLRCFLKKSRKDSVRS